MSDENGVRVADCCADQSNLEEQPTGRDDLVIRKCRVCGRRHFEAYAEPFEIRTEVL